MPLIIVIVMLSVIFAIKIKDTICDTSISAKQAEYDKIQSEIVNRCEYKIMYAFHDNRWEAAQSISDDLEEIFGHDWKQILEKERPDISWSYQKSVFDSFSCAWNIVFEMWYSKQGYIPQDGNRYNLRATPLFKKETGIKKTIDIQNIQESHVADVCCRIDTGMKICRVIEENMRDAHPQLNLRLCCGDYEGQPDMLVWDHKYKSVNIKPIYYPW